MKRTNIIVGKAAAVQAGGGAPGGELGVLFVDTTSEPFVLSLIMPDGSKRVSQLDENKSLGFVSKS